MNTNNSLHLLPYRGSCNQDVLQVYMISAVSVAPNTVTMYYCAICTFRTSEISDKSLEYVGI